MMELKMEVYSPTLELLGILEIQKSVIWEEKAFSSGSFSLESLITDETLKLLQPENIIWIAGEDAGIIEYVQEEAGADGPYITVKGQTLTGILDRRILWGLYSLKGTPPEIMRYLVDDCAINPTRGDVEARKIPSLVALDAPLGGSPIQIQKTGGTLLEALKQLGETYGVAFGVRFNPAVPRMEFWTRWGQDRSIRQTVNEPVLYSTELDDVLSSEYSYNSQDYRNIALVAGEGEGNKRVYVTVTGDGEDIPTPPTPMKYTVTVSVEPEGGGIATGGGTYQEGESVTVTASPANSYNFTGWQENGTMVSADMEYTFTVAGDRNLTAVFEQIRTERLPEGYIENEYIETSSVYPGGQYIDTGFVPDQNTRVVADFQIVSLQWQYITIFGERGNNGSGFFLYAQDGLFTAMYGSAYVGIGNTVANATNRHICDFNKNVITFDDTVKTVAEQIFTGAGNLTLCCLNENGSQSLYGNVRYFSCKIYSDEQIVRDFVPCTNPDGVAGLYDLVGKTFYQNSGIGEIVAGPAV